MHNVPLGADQAGVFQTRSSSLRTRVKDVLTLLGKSWWAIFHAIVGSVGSAMSSLSLAVAGQRQNRRPGRFDVTTRVHVARHAGDYT
jgi:hypothetical protein